MPENALRTKPLRRSECKYQTVTTWERSYLRDHRESYLEGLRRIRPTMEAVAGAGADRQYLSFLIENWTPVDYTHFDWNKVRKSLQQVEAALDRLKQLARDGDLPGESVVQLENAWFEFVCGPRGRRKLMAEIFVDLYVPRRRGRPDHWRFKRLAFLVYAHLQERGIKPRWKWTGELIQPFAPEDLICDGEHLRQMLVNFRRTEGPGGLERLKSQSSMAYTKFRNAPMGE